MREPALEELCSNTSPAGGQNRGRLASDQIRSRITTRRSGERENSGGSKVCKKQAKQALRRTEVRARWRIKRLNTADEMENASPGTKSAAEHKRPTRSNRWQWRQQNRGRKKEWPRFEAQKMRTTQPAMKIRSMPLLVARKSSRRKTLRGNPTAPTIRNQEQQRLGDRE
jgi:hypothetical protein